MRPCRINIGLYQRQSKNIIFVSYFSCRNKYVNLDLFISEYHNFAVHDIVTLLATSILRLKDI